MSNWHSKEPEKPYRFHRNLSMASLITLTRATISSSTKLLKPNPSLFIPSRSLYTRDPFPVLDYDDAALPQRYLGNDIVSVKNPFQISGAKGSFNVKTKEDGIHMRLDMPGVGNDMRVWVEKDRVIYEGKAPIESEHEESGRNYGGFIELIPGFSNVKAIKAEVKNGVVRIFIPALMLEEKKDVHIIQVD